METSFDVIVVGAGPAGYVSAIRCAQLGLKTVCVESWVDVANNPVLGGTCLNIGCIPSKALLESSALYEKLKSGIKQHGISTEKTHINIAQMINRKNIIVNELTQGVQGLFAANKVALISGVARLRSKGQVSVEKTGSNEVVVLNASHIILATGSSPIEIPSARFDGNAIVDSTGGLEFSKVPKTLGVIGAGAIGLELGSVWSRLGSTVKIFEALPDFLALADEQIAKEAGKHFRQQGLDIQTNTLVTRCEHKGEKVKVTFTQDGKEHLELVDKMIVAVGRRPNSENIAADNAGLKIDNGGFVSVDDRCRTSIEGVYAIGDLVRGPMLAHKGSEEGMMVAELIAGNYAQVNYENIPAIIYTHPEIAWVGKTEKELKDAGQNYRTGVFPFAASGRARASGDTAGMVKVIADVDTDSLLGVHMIGPHCSELIMQACIAIELKASAEDLALTMFAHPTLSEALHEASLAVDGRAIHIAKLRRA